MTGTHKTETREGAGGEGVTVFVLGFVCERIWVVVWEFVLIENNFSTIFFCQFSSQPRFFSCRSQWVGTVWIPKEFVLLEYSHPEMSALL